MLYHNYPQQRTLVVAHSNQALNDAFSKTIERDVPARYLLRLGMGQEDLDTDVDFSRTGMLPPLLLIQATTAPERCLSLTSAERETAKQARVYLLLHSCIVHWVIWCTPVAVVSQQGQLQRHGLECSSGAPQDI